MTRTGLQGNILQENRWRCD